MSKTRAGRKAAETHKRFLRDVGNFAAAFAAKEWKYTQAETEALKIIRTARADQSNETISFSKAYGELALWEGKSPRSAFANISDLGLTDFLADEFTHGAVIHTAKAVYRLAKTDFQTTVGTH